jgi:hypothetical protein
MGLPYGWKMWVKEVPIKGMWVTFENWTTLQTGMKVSTKHKGISTTISLEDVHGTYDFIGMDFDDDPFMLLDSRVQSN